MLSAALMWQVFIILLVVHTLARRRAKGGEVPFNALMVMALAATLVAAVALAGVPHAIGMAIVWGVVAAYGVPESGSGKARGRAGKAPAKKSAKGPARAGDLHMERLSRGEISLDEYFKEGEKQSRDGARKLQALAATPEIAEVLSRRQLTLRGFLGLRERLVEVRDLEWTILSDPKHLDKLIRLVQAKKTQSEIGLAFRGLLARPASAT